MLNLSAFGGGSLNMSAFGQDAPQTKPSKPFFPTPTGEPIKKSQTATMSNLDLSAFTSVISANKGTGIPLSYATAKFQSGDPSLIKLPFTDKLVSAPIKRNFELDNFINETAKFFVELPEKFVNNMKDVGNIVFSKSHAIAPRSQTKPQVPTFMDAAVETYQTALDKGFTDTQAKALGVTNGVGNFLVDMGISADLATPLARVAVRQLPRNLLVKIQTTDIAPIEIRAALTGQEGATPRATGFVQSLSNEERKSLFSIVRQSEELGTPVTVTRGTEPTALGKFAGLQPTAETGFARTMPDMQLPGYLRPDPRTGAIGELPRKKVGGVPEVSKDLDPLAAEAQTLEWAKGTRAAGIQNAGLKNFNEATRFLEKAGELPKEIKTEKVTKDFIQNYYEVKKPPVVGDVFVNAKGERIEITKIESNSINYFLKGKNKGIEGKIYTDKGFLVNKSLDNGLKQGINNQLPESLVNEARKYKSAEEFVKAQGTPKLYNVGDSFEMGKIVENPFKEGVPSVEKAQEINKYLQANKDKYNPKYIKFYHGTAKGLPIEEKGLLPTSATRRKSYQSESGYIYLANTPERAKTFGDLGNMSNSEVYEVVVPVNKLLPDLDQLNNLRSTGEKIGNTLGDSIAYGGGVRIKGKIEPYSIRKLPDDFKTKSQLTDFYNQATKGSDKIPVQEFAKVRVIENIGAKAFKAIPEDISTKIRQTGGAELSTEELKALAKALQEGGYGGELVGRRITTHGGSRVATVLGVDQPENFGEQYILADHTTRKVRWSPLPISEESIIKQKGLGGGEKPPVPPEPPKELPAPFQEPTGGDAVQRVSQALKGAKSTRKQQETLYSQERAKRIARVARAGETTSGEKGFYTQLGQLKGELPKAEFEAIRNKISQQDIDSLFDLVKNNRLLNEWDKISARQGLAKLFGEFGGRVPTESELNLLSRVFPKEFIDTLLEKRALWDKIKEMGLQVANLPRSIMASFDLSAPLRQGLFFLGRGKQFFPAFSEMFKSFGSEKAFKEVQEEIVRRPNFELMRESKLAITEMDRVLTQREEQFMSSLAEKIPVLGRVVRASGRAYVAFLNKLRADVFDDLISKAETLGLRPKQNMDLVKEIAAFINAGTGRGSLGSLERSATALNAFFFSPRLMASRLTLLNPYYYVKSDPFVRKEALKSLFSLAGILGTVLGLAKLSGAEVTTDPRNSDFAKIKIGNTRIDPMGGFQQYIRMFSQLITGKYISSTTGKEYTLGEGYKPLTRFDIILRQIESKEAPVFSFVTDLLRGQDYAGKPIEIPKEVADRFYPMVVSGIVDIAKDNPNLLPAGLLSVFGVGVQTYEPQRKSEGLKVEMPSLKIPSLKIPSLKL